MDTWSDTGSDALGDIDRYELGSGPSTVEECIAECTTVSLLSVCWYTRGVRVGMVARTYMCRARTVHYNRNHRMRKRFNIESPS